MTRALGWLMGGWVYFLLTKATHYGGANACLNSTQNPQKNRKP